MVIFASLAVRLSIGSKQGYLNIYLETLELLFLRKPARSRDTILCAPALFSVMPFSIFDSPQSSPQTPAGPGGSVDKPVVGTTYAYLYPRSRGLVYVGQTCPDTRHRDQKHANGKETLFDTQFTGGPV